MKNEKYKTGLISLIIIFLIIIGIVVASIVNPSFFSGFSKNKSTSVNGTVISKKNTKEYIATIDIVGTIENENYSYNQSWLLSTITKLKNDRNNIGIVLYINSPGGGAYQADEVYLALLDYKTTGKNIYVYMGPMAASGGYYIACAGDKIFANRNTLTGSIGVIATQTLDLSGLYEKLGIKSETIHAGKNKNMGNSNEPLTNEQRAILQSIADECYEQFVSIVSESRKIDYKETCKLADGRVYTAKQALDKKLIDVIGSWDNCITAAQNYFSNEEVTIKEFKYERQLTFFEKMMYTYSNIEEAKVAAKLGLPKKAVEDMNNFNSYPAYILQ